MSDVNLHGASRAFVVLKYNISMERIHTDYIKQIFEKLDNINHILDSFYSTLSAFTPNEYTGMMTIEEKIDRVKHAIDSDMKKSSPESKL